MFFSEIIYLAFTIINNKIPPLRIKEKGILHRAHFENN